VSYAHVLPFFVFLSSGYLSILDSSIYSLQFFFRGFETATVQIFSCSFVRSFIDTFVLLGEEFVLRLIYLETNVRIGDRIAR
jgi:hypothetical protein